MNEDSIGKAISECKYRGITMLDNLRNQNFTVCKLSSKPCSRVIDQGGCPIVQRIEKAEQNVECR